MIDQKVEPVDQTKVKLENERDQSTSVWKNSKSKSKKIIQRTKLTRLTD